jgi:CubicO group peptidase (beta-lactamase class C family)
MKTSILLLLLMPLFLQGQPFKQSELERIVKEAFAQQKAAGASVLIAQNGKIILNKGYGYAHLGFRVPATAETKYFIIGPGTTMLAAGIMQQVEKGNMSLDDELTKHLPDFDVQGERITIKHLLTSTSGIPDYHYLGDPIDGQKYQPRALDEVIAMFANKPYTIKPGTKFDWSISNFALLVAVLQKVSKQFYEEYIKEKFVSALSLNETEYLTQRIPISRFAQGYRTADTSLNPSTESLLKYDPSLRLVSTTADMYKFWEGLKQNKVISKNTFTLMTSKEEAAKNNSGTYGYAIRLNKLENYDAVGISGGLQGYSSFLFNYPQKDFTVIVLSNTDNQAASRIGTEIARNLFGLPPIPVRENSKKILIDLPATNDEKLKVKGTYIVKRSIVGNSPATVNLYKRTVRIFIENEQLMFQRFGEMPEPLLKQADGNFSIQSSPFMVVSFKDENKNVILTMAYPGSTDTGLRIGNADVKTFHQAAFENLK